ncbi:MAG: hypothetical protein Q7R94_00420, partial [bacterium]|nr:hypothetical protein [bacterium]
MRNFESQIENEPLFVHVHRFFDISRDEETRLKEKVNKNDGLVRVFIHPDFEQYAKFDDAKPSDVDALGKAEAAFERILTSKSDDLPPLFIFESGRDPDEFLEGEKRLDATSKNDLYIIRTQMANPDPLS